MGKSAAQRSVGVASAAAHGRLRLPLGVHGLSLVRPNLRQRNRRMQSRLYDSLIDDSLKVANLNAK